MLASRGDSRLVLGQVKALKFGNFVRPNEALEVEVTLDKDLGDGAYAFEELIAELGAASVSQVVGTLELKPAASGAITPPSPKTRPPKTTA
ncbi:MAG: hypothetical protein IH820_14835 [Bacteroidetes bacterium]|nr:hypothetical protein [Bacteroidota bacterium]